MSRKATVLQAACQWKGSGEEMEAPRWCWHMEWQKPNTRLFWALLLPCHGEFLHATNPQLPSIREDASTVVVAGVAGCVTRGNGVPRAQGPGGKVQTIIRTYSSP